MTTSIQNSKLDELAAKSAQKNNGVPAHYITANQALRDDVCAFILSITAKLEQQLSECKQELQASAKRETILIARIDALEGKQKTEPKPVKSSTSDFFIVGSSLLRAVRPSDLKNGEVLSIPGGTTKEIGEKIKSITHKPKSVIVQVGGNDICKEGATVESVSTDYVALLTQIKDKLPETSVVISGLPPRFPDESVRTQVKDLNETMNKWANENQIQFVDNEAPFELKSGAVDSSAYVMSGATPCVHLNRRGTIRWLENLAKYVPALLLSETLSEGHPSYAEAVAKDRANDRGQRREGHTTRGSAGTTAARQRGCYNCGERNHTASVCRLGRRIRCHFCSRVGHKWQRCWDRPDDWQPTSDPTTTPAERHGGPRHNRDARDDADWSDNRFVSPAGRREHRGHYASGRHGSTSGY